MHRYEVEERMIGTTHWTKAHLLADVPDARSVPQIIINGVHIGGLQELTRFVRAL